MLKPTQINHKTSAQKSLEEHWLRGIDACTYVLTARMIVPHMWRGGCIFFIERGALPPRVSGQYMYSLSVLSSLVNFLALQTPILNGIVANEIQRRHEKINTVKIRSIDHS